MEYYIDQDALSSRSFKVRQITLMLLVLASIISSLYFYSRLKEQTIELIRSEQILKDQQKEISQKSDSVIVLMKQITVISADSQKWAQANEMLKELNNKTLIAKASSHLAAGSSKTYFAQNAIDGDRTTAWAEGAEGDGIGESLTIDLVLPNMINGIKIINGYSYYKDDRWGNRYEKNGRLKKVQLSFSDTSADTIVTFKDHIQDFQEIRFPTVKTKFVKITILEVYAGSDFEDTCISEVALLYPD